MRVKKWMTRDIVTVQADEPAQNAWEIITSQNIRQLPVMKAGDVIGVISRGDILRYFQDNESEFPGSETPVERVMTGDLLTVGPDTPFEEATSKMYQGKVGSLLVLDEDKLVGILTRSDLFAAIMEITGMKDSVRREEFADTHLGKCFTKLREQPRNMYAKSFLAYREEDGKNWICLTRFAERDEE